MPVDKQPNRPARIADAAEYASLSPSTVRRYIDSGRLTGYRLGVKFLRVDLDEMDALLAPIERAAS